jgi:hypothetical protein
LSEGDESHDSGARRLDFSSLQTIMKIQMFSPRVLSLAILAASLVEARPAPFSTTTPAPPVTPAMPPAGQGTPPNSGTAVPPNSPKPAGIPIAGTPAAGVNNGVNFGSIPAGNVPEPVLPSTPAPNTATGFGAPAPRPQLTDPNAAAVPPTFYTSTNGFAAPLTNGFAQPMTNGFAAPLTNGFGTMKK